MGLKQRLRGLLLRNGLHVAMALVPRSQRPLYAELNRLRAGDVMLDFGANVGRTVFAKLAAAVGGRPRIHLENVAVGEADGIARLYLRKGYLADNRRHLASSSLRADKFNVDPDRYYDVSVRAAASVVEAHSGIALVKIDVEGAEYGILRRLIESGAAARIARIVVETHEDRIAGLRETHADIEALIAARGPEARIRFGWA